MPGTFTDQAALAVNNAFIDKCRVAILFRSVELLDSTSKQDLSTLQIMLTALRNAGGDASSMAWRVAVCSPTIAAASPAIPTDTQVQQAVNILMAKL